MIDKKIKIINQPQVFTIWSDEVEGRIDPSFYRPEFLELNKQIEKLEFDYLGEIVDFSSEIWDQKSIYGNEFPYIEISAIDTATGEIQKVDYISTKEAPSRAKMIIRKSDIIISTTRPQRGAISWIDDSKDGFIASTGFAILRNLKTNKINKNYLFAILRTNFILDQMLQRCSGGNYPAITAEELENIKIPLPSLPTQNKIVSIMSKAYEEKKRKEIKAEEILNSIDDFVLKELKIKMPEIEKEMVFEVWSDEMENKRIDAEYWQPYLEEVERSINNGKYKTEKLKKYITKIHYGASTSNAYIDGGIPLLRILNLKPNNLNLSKVVYLPESFRKELGNAFVKTGDLLISRSGTVGVVTVISKEADGFAFGSFMIKFCLNDKINKEFVSIWLNNKLNKLLTEREKIGAIQGNITISTIENFNIPIPSLLIQKKIAEKIELYYFQSKKLKKEAKEVLEKAKEKVEEMILK